MKGVNPVDVVSPPSSPPSKRTKGVDVDNEGVPFPVALVTSSFGLEFTSPTGSIFPSEDHQTSISDVHFLGDDFSGSDFELSDSDSDDEDVVPCEDISIRQNKLLRTFDSTNNIFGTRQKAIDQTSAFAIFDFCTNHSLSVNGSHQLLKLIQLLFQRNHGKGLDMFKSWRAFKDCFDKLVFEVFPIVDYSADLPSYYFGKYEIEGEEIPLKKITSKRLDILSVVAEFLLRLDPAKFVFEYKPSIDERGVRLFSDFASSDRMQKVNAHFTYHRRHDGVAVIPIVIGLTTDATLLSGSSGASESPVLIYPMNSVGGQLDYYFVGFVPQKLPYSDEDLHALLEYHGYNGKAERCLIIEMVKRDMLLQFLHASIHDLIGNGHNLFRVQIGFGSVAKHVLASFCLGQISGDGELLRKITGTHFKRKQCGCRMCCDKSLIMFHDHPSDEVVRCDHEHQTLTDNATCCLEVKILSEPKQRMSAEGKRLAGRLKDLGLSYGSNPLYADFLPWSRKLLSTGFGLHSSLPPDTLHVLHLGLVKDVVGSSLHIINKITIMDKEDFGGSWALLNERIKLFPSFNSLGVIKPFRFVNGLSCLINSTTTTSMRKKSHSTGLLTGRIEAWKMPTLALQLMICCEDLLPAKADWLESFGISKDVFRFSVKNCILSALGSLLDFIFMNNSKVMSEDEVDSNMFYTINVLRFHHLKLRMLHRILNEVGYHPRDGWKYDVRINKNPLSWSSVYVGEKGHVVYHFRYFKKEVGADKSLCDQEIPELKHKSLVKKTWLGCSKRPAVYIEEMTRAICRDMANFFIKFCLNQSHQACLQDSRETLCLARLSSRIPMVSDTPPSMRSSKLVFHVAESIFKPVFSNRELYKHIKLGLFEITEILRGMGVSMGDNISLVEHVNVYESGQKAWRLKVSPQSKNILLTKRSIVAKGRLDVPVYSFVNLSVGNDGEPCVYLPALVGAIVKISHGSEHSHILVVLPLSPVEVTTTTIIPMARFVLHFPLQDERNSWRGVSLRSMVQPCACFPRFSKGRSMIDLLASSHDGEEFYVLGRVDVQYGCGHLQDRKMQKWPKTWFSNCRLLRYLNEFGLRDEKVVIAVALNDPISEELSIPLTGEEGHTSDNDTNSLCIDSDSDCNDIELDDDVIVDLDDEGRVDYMDHGDDYDENEDVTDPDYVGED